jgi:hypothetical protein
MCQACQQRQLLRFFMLNAAGVSLFKLQLAAGQTAFGRTIGMPFRNIPPYHKSRHVHASQYRRRPHRLLHVYILPLEMFLWVDVLTALKRR